MGNKTARLQVKKRKTNSHIDITCKDRKLDHSSPGIQPSPSSRSKRSWRRPREAVLIRFNYTMTRSVVRPFVSKHAWIMLRARYSSRMREKENNFIDNTNALRPDTRGSRRVTITRESRENAWCCWIKDNNFPRNIRFHVEAQLSQLSAGDEEECLIARIVNRASFAIDSRLHACRKTIEYIEI